MDLHLCPALTDVKEVPHSISIPLRHDINYVFIIELPNEVEFLHCVDWTGHTKGQGQDLWKAQREGQSECLQHRLLFYWCTLGSLGLVWTRWPISVTEVPTTQGHCYMLSEVWSKIAIFGHLCLHEIWPFMSAPRSDFTFFDQFHPHADQTYFLVISVRMADRTWNL